MIQLKVNGVEQSFSGDPNMPLLWYLRDVLGMTGSKFGCGIGALRRVYGPCKRTSRAILRNHHARCRSGKRKSLRSKGSRRTDLHPVQKAWMQINVPQCGYCQVGQMMQAAALLNTKKRPTEAEIDAAMSGNICRCGTYQRIRAAIKAAAG